MLPNLIIIGAMKSGTTSLHYYLSLHPQVYMSREKELEFFIEERNWSKGVVWYANHFKQRSKIYGESSPNYTNYPRFPGVPTRMHALVPDVKLIYVVRDPIERMISHYIHNYSADRENRPIQEALRNRNSNQYLNCSLYYTQLEQYLPYYSASQILVITAEDLWNLRRLTVRQVFEFLGVDTGFYCRRYAIRRHSTARKRRKTKIGMVLTQTTPAKVLKSLPMRLRWPIEDLFYLPFSRRIQRPHLRKALRQDLKERLGEDVEKLRSFTGRKFENWSL